MFSGKFMPPYSVVEFVFSVFLPYLEIDSSGSFFIVFSFQVITKLLYLLNQGETFTKVNFIVF